MLFKKKAKQEAIEIVENEEITNTKEEETESVKPPEVEEPILCRAREKGFVLGYVLRGFSMWNFNHPKEVIPESELEKILLGVRMATASTTTNKAFALYEEYQKKQG